MPFVFELNGNVPAVAVYEVDANDTDDRTPFTSPTSSQAVFDRVKFHSNFAYPQIVATAQYTLNLPLFNTRNTVRDVDIVLGAHGQSGQPWVIATTTIQGTEIAFAGSVCVGLVRDTVFSPAREVGGLGRWVTIGANGTNIIAHDYCVMPDLTGFRHDAISLTIDCYITNRILDT